MSQAKETIISVDNVSITYKSLPGGQRTLKGYVVHGLLKGRAKILKTVPHLRDISFNVLRGEQIGLVGRNGAGKSTLLKLVAGVLRPDYGSISVKGSITPLIDLGTGMHPDLTVAENIRVSGAYLGWNPSETRMRIRPILEWAELTQFENQPFHTLSTGMQSRLAFAVATSQQPDIVLVDEVLSVGDISFQEKSSERMDQLRNAGSASLVVSHDLAYLRQHTSRVIWIESGYIYRDGRSSEVIDEYERSFH